MYPSNLKYTKDHEWIDAAEETATVGITFFAQKELGDVVFVELPEIGKKVKAGDEFGTIESVKAISEIYSPASGEVVEVNESLRDEPEKINKDPYAAGWILKLRLTSPAELDDLMDSGAYEKHVGSGGH